MKIKKLTKALSKGFVKSTKGVGKAVDGLIDGRAKKFTFKKDKQFILNLGRVEKK